MTARIDVEGPIRRHLLAAHARLTLLQYELMTPEQQEAAKRGQTQLGPAFVLGQLNAILLNGLEAFADQFAAGMRAHRIHTNYRDLAQARSLNIPDQLARGFTPATIEPRRSPEKD